jgi:NAD(P)-dependent dehydrogenase (short-subunit alcohol dehydrogenase family)
LITLNLAPGVVGCATAIRRFLAAGTGGAVVNVSSHQAQRPVTGAMPYATAKAAVEGLTRALAVDCGRRGIRVNAVALGSIATERYERISPSGSPRLPREPRSSYGATTRSAASAARTRSQRRSRTCFRTTPASSTAPSCGRRR